MAAALTSVSSLGMTTDAGGSSRPKPKRSRETKTTTTFTPEKTVISLLILLCIIWVTGCTLYVGIRLHYRFMMQANNNKNMEGPRPVSPQAALLAHQHHPPPNFLRSHHHPTTNTSTTTTDPRNHDLNELPSSPTILSRAMHHVTATADVRGNLGPIDVVLQDLPGANWLKDRRQAASDMHGTNIPGAHWVQLDFGGGHEQQQLEQSQSQSTTPQLILPTSIVLDWEAAYAQDYVLQASATHAITGHPDQQPSDSVWTLFDGRQASERQSFLQVRETGQSPGVKQPTPLHVIHTIQLSSNNNTNSNGNNNNNKSLPSSQRPLRYLRLFILKSARGWGVSLWQFDVYGYSVTTTTT